MRLLESSGSAPKYIPFEMTLNVFSWQFKTHLAPVKILILFLIVLKLHNPTGSNTNEMFEYGIRNDWSHLYKMSNVVTFATDTVEALALTLHVTLSRTPTNVLSVKILLQ
jgi:hypothetical protein